jgi:hypothetical protein
MAEDNGQRSDAELGELAAFADGSLAAAPRARLEARAARTPELRALVEEQRRAIAAVEALDARAPTVLRARLGTVRPAASREPRRWAFAGSLAAAAAIAAAVLAVVLVGGARGPTVGEAVESAQRGPTDGAPETADDDPNLLAASVSGVAFPDYSRAFGWRAVGERTDELDGRQTRTVFYGRGGRQVSYTIVAGKPLAWPENSRTTRRDGIELRSLENDGTTVVTWLRNGHTCVLAGDGVRQAVLLELAAWMGDGSVRF